jgi:mono/diheme cytochrome c family protein
LTVEAGAVRTLRLGLATAMVLLAHGGGALAQPPKLGEAIYRHGVRASGDTVRATAANGLAVSGAAAACVGCHRRSGLGGAEGQSRIRPIAGRVLFSAPETELTRRWRVESVAGVRPAYTRGTLARALREGVDSAGRPLDALMPRYALEDEEIAQLHAYLAGLSADPAPGVTPHQIHVATIVAPGVDAGLRRAMLDVMNTFVRDKNSGTRLETRRRAVGTEAMYLAYRSWVLHVWELQGEPHTWRAQLDDLYCEQPVFAVIGGLGRGSWQPVHAFCETAQVPCIFPDVDYPVQQGEGYYSMYFSRGLALEAQVLASQLAQAGDAGTIVQVFRDDELGRVPAQALREALQPLGLAGKLADVPLAAKAPFASGTLPKIAGDATLVAWLGPDDLRALLGSPPPESLRSLYLSASLAGTPDAKPWPASWRERARMVHVFETPERRASDLARLKAWLRLRQLAPGDMRVQANAYFAITLAADAITGLGDNFSRDYFIERIEQMVESSPSPSVYPRLSLGPGQRFASRGGYILGFAPTAGAPIPVSEWLVP